MSSDDAQRPGTVRDRRRHEFADGGWGPSWRRRRRPVFLVPVLVGAVQVIGANLAVHSQPEATPLDALGYWLLLIGPIALVGRRLLPLPALAVTTAATVGYLALAYPRGPFFLAALVALFGAVRRSYRPAVWVMTAVAYVVLLVVWPAPIGMEIAVGAWVAVAVVLAEAARVRGERFAEMATARAEAARARQEQSRRQASDERLAIARELHDVLGHHLSLINVRAGVALHLLDSDPEQAREALGAIKVASSEALREVRGVLAALSPQNEAPRTPAPGLADIEALADEARAAGLAVTTRQGPTTGQGPATRQGPTTGQGPATRQGPPATVPGEVDRAAYRIVQEALTNVRRHAGPDATVDITIGHLPDALTIRVDDTGAVPSESTSDGNGIPGMRERAVALGGTLTAGPLAGGGFRVDARLPFTTDPRPPSTHATTDARLPLTRENS